VTSEPDLLERALAAVDAANAEDPFRITIAGEAGPKELLHGRRVCEWILLMDPDASDVQLIAGRAHHLRRWTRPRSDFPEGRAGYLRWRAAAKKAHASEVSEIVVAAGYDESVADDVGVIIRKEGLATDPRVLVHEDALCLVFLESQFDPLIDQLGEEHTTEVLRKTAAKMSAGGIALGAALPLSERGRTLLLAAVGGG
jgi:hypothetical protein